MRPICFAAFKIDDELKLRRLRLLQPVCVFDRCPNRRAEITDTLFGVPIHGPVVSALASLTVGCALGLFVTPTKVAEGLRYRVSASSPILLPIA